MGRLVKLGKISDLSETRMKTFQVNEERILLINLEGEFYAVEDKCPHMGYPLSMGSINDKILTCGFHYAKFNIVDGSSFSSLTDKPLKKYKVILKEGEVFIELKE